RLLLIDVYGRKHFLVFLLVARYLCTERSSWMDAIFSLRKKLGEQYWSWRSGVSRHWMWCWNGCGLRGLGPIRVGRRPSRERGRWVALRIFGRILVLT